MSTNGVSKTSLVGILTTIVLAGGAGWMSYVQSGMNALATEQKYDKTEQAKRASEAAVVKEKVERLEKDVGEIKVEQKDQTKKLDELLRRSRP